MLKQFLSWVVEKQSIVWFLHLLDIRRSCLLTVRPTFSLSSRISFMSFEKLCMRFHFFSFSISLLIFFSNKLIFNSIKISTFSQRQSCTNSACEYVWSSEFSQKMSFKNTCWNSKFWYRRVNCVFLSTLRESKL